MAALSSILLILLNLAFITIVVGAIAEVWLRLTRKHGLGRDMWSSLLISTGVVLIAVVTLTISI